MNTCESCERCKRYIKQGGTCNGYRNKCLHYNEEPRGRIITKPIKIICAEDSEMPVIKPKSKLELDGLDEITVRRIESVDIINGIVVIIAEVYSELYDKAQEEQEARMFKREFRVLKGGKE